MSDKVLIVDDDPRLLASSERNLRKHFTVITAEGPEEGLRLIDAEDEFAVVVSDMRMPGMNGAQFLAEVQKRSPDTVRLILTGHSDQAMTIEAVNQGNLFRFLTKPCSVPDLVQAISSALRQHELQRAERDLLERTVTGAVEVLAEVLALVNPVAFGRAQLLKRRVLQVAKVLGVPSTWPLEIAAHLSQLGCLTLPQETVERGYQGLDLGPQAKDLLARHPEIGANLLRRIPRLETSAAIVAHQHHDWKELRALGASLSEEVRIGAGILSAAAAFETHKAAGADDDRALALLREREDSFAPSIVAALSEAAAERTLYSARTIDVSELRPGMILAQELRSPAGVLLISRGQVVTETLCLRLQNFAQSLGLTAKPIQVFVPST